MGPVLGPGARHLDWAPGHRLRRYTRRTTYNASNATYASVTASHAASSGTSTVKFSK